MNTQNALLKQKKNGSLIIQDDVTVPLKRMKAIEIIVDSTHPINDNPDSDIYYESLSNAPSMINLEDIGIIDETIFPPVVSARGDENYITIGILLTAKTQKALVELDTLKFNYQLIINTLGLPQLNIYVCYSENDLGIKPKYWDNCFQINFSEHITPKVNLSEIATIEVFLIDEDPRTSRGTVTTVKKPM